jgi:hypothetical protein
MKTTVRIEGLRETEAALKQLPKATGKNVLRRVLREIGEPIAADAAASADQVSGDLARSFGVGTRLSPNQSALHKKMFKDDKASVEMFVGAGPLPQAHLEEFGSIRNAPTPMLRPAWDAHARSSLDGIAEKLWGHIKAASDRLARKAARAARKAKGR